VAPPVAEPTAPEFTVGAQKAGPKAPAKAPHVAKAPAKAVEPVVPKPRSVVQPMKAAPPKPPEKKPSRAAVPVEEAWTRAELNAVRKELEQQARDLRGEIDDAEEVQATLKRDASSEGSGDEADAGTKTFEREHEMSLANNSRDLLLQVERALGRLDAGTYGRCENCGDPIPKARLQAFPRATLCVACKQREERR
jgi:DnaK suppressor protein